MKRGFSLLFAALISACCLFGGVTAFGAGDTAVQTALLSNVPYLESISFTNADIDGGFSKDKTNFTVTLKDPAISPMLKSYGISGEAKIFVTYSYDETGRQTGIVVTLSFESGSIIYTFNYSNPQEYAVTNNKNLTALICEYGEVQPTINAEDTVYQLYIPSDLTQLDITPVTEDVNARCAPLSVEINIDQQPDLSFTVVASDGTTKQYKFKVKRVNKSLEEVKAEMNAEDYVSFVSNEKFYQQPLFMIIVCSVAGGILVIALLAAVTKRLTITPYDKEEKSFYASR
ncbi:MAG: hypothetical protein J1E05_05370 [Eubacterium sp.]|nr:hypothetical protein [Eubacterium sp.]